MYFRGGGCTYGEYRVLDWPRQDPCGYPDALAALRNEEPGVVPGECVYLIRCERSSLLALVAGVEYCAVDKPSLVVAVARRIQVGTRSRILLGAFDNTVLHTTRQDNCAVYLRVTGLAWRRPRAGDFVGVSKLLNASTPHVYAHTRKRRPSRVVVVSSATPLYRLNVIGSGSPALAYAQPNRAPIGLG
eukprot:scaffold1518_cov417-Prasinococcus_capsulatus_cf.AAC.16